MRTLLKFLAVGAPMGLFLLFSTPTHAMTIIGGIPSATVTSNTTSVALSTITITCDANNEISTANPLLITLNYVPNSGFTSDTNPVIFDTTSVVLGSSVGTGAIATSPTIMESQIRFTVSQSCVAGTVFHINGVQVKPSTTIKKEGTERIYAQSTGMNTSSNTFLVDNNPPRLTSGDVSDAVGNKGVATNMTLYFSEPVIYESSEFSTSHWTANKIVTFGTSNIGNLTLTLNRSNPVQAPQASLSLNVVPESGSVPTTYGLWDVKANPSTLVRDASGNKLSTDQIISVRDAMRPVIKSFTPTVSSIGITPNAPLMVGFSESMAINDTSVVFSPIVTFTKQWSADLQTLTITPTNQVFSTVYQVTVSGKSLNGAEVLYQTATSPALSTPSSYTTQAASQPPNDPTLALSISSGASSTYSPLVSITVSSTYADQIQYGTASDLSNASNYETLTSLKSWTLSPGTGNKQVCARVRSSTSGKVSPISCASINLLAYGTNAPTNTSFLINNGAVTTDSSTVTLYLNATNATHIAVSNNSSFSEAVWESMSATKSWYLSGTGSRTVWVQFRNSYGISGPLSSSINYQTSGTVQPTGSLLVANGVSSISSIYTLLNLASVGADQMQFGTNINMTDAGGYETYSTQKSWTLKPRVGTQSVCVRFRNSSSGAVSEVQCDGITLSSDGIGSPTGGAVSINNGVATTNSALVTLTTTAQSASKIAVANESDFVGAAWEDYSTSRQWYLPSASGPKTVYVMFAAGNGAVSPIASATILITGQQTIPPVVTGKIKKDLPSGLSGGMLVKVAGKPAVYYVGADGYRYVFPNQNVFYSWYSVTDLQGTDKGGLVVTIAPTTLASLPIGGNVTYRPGSRMVKIESDPSVYVVDKGGVLRWVKNESIAFLLYGSQWYKQIDDISVALFTGYKMGNDVATASDYNLSGVKNNVPTIAVDKGL